ncbi:hypothetical protein PF005_g20842 [Phytophthora fragariae]|uniref:Uncharacterized protein n=1 Tax=Phytophthora fragariae TaxID=53985 RepID=A0A6A3IW41_9STRA|nr:hypothetical protein PF011_g19636 [Phytophthora fragariae]KAE9186458.1 hypothetical protein PF005_g20842 [Phytophthora fragariae]
MNSGVMMSPAMAESMKSWISSVRGRPMSIAKYPCCSILWYVDTSLKAPASALWRATTRDARASINVRSHSSVRRRLSSSRARSDRRRRAARCAFLALAQLRERTTRGSKRLRGRAMAPCGTPSSSSLLFQRRSMLTRQKAN